MINKYAIICEMALLNYRVAAVKPEKADIRKSESFHHV